MAISKLTGQLEIGAAPYRFPSSSVVGAAEWSDTLREVCELALAHVHTDAIEVADRWTDLLGRRRTFMEQWATHLVGDGEDYRATLAGLRSCYVRV